MDVLNGLVGIFSGGTVGIVLKLVLGLGVGILVVLFLRWLQNQKNEQAEKDTNQNRAKDQASLGDQNKVIGHDAQSSENDIEKLIKQHENPPKN